MATVYTLNNGAVVLVPDTVQVCVISPTVSPQAVEARVYAAQLREFADAVEKAGRTLENDAPRILVPNLLHSDTVSIVESTEPRPGCTSDRKYRGQNMKIGTESCLEPKDHGPEVKHRGMSGATW